MESRPLRSWDCKSREASRDGWCLQRCCGGWETSLPFGSWLGMLLCNIWSFWIKQVTHGYLMTTYTINTICFKEFSVQAVWFLLTQTPKRPGNERHFEIWSMGRIRVNLLYSLIDMCLQHKQIFFNHFGASSNDAPSQSWGVEVPYCLLPIKVLVMLPANSRSPKLRRKHNTGWLNTVCLPAAAPQPGSNQLCTYARVLCCSCGCCLAVLLV